MAREERIERIVAMIPNKTQQAKVILEVIKASITLHKYFVGFEVFINPFLSMEGGEAVLEAFRRVNNSNKEKQELRELIDYWHNNYGKILRMLIKES